MPEFDTNMNQKLIVKIVQGKGTLAQRAAMRRLQQLLIADTKNPPSSGASGA